MVVIIHLNVFALLLGHLLALLAVVGGGLVGGLVVDRLADLLIGGVALLLAVGDTHLHEVGTVQCNMCKVQYNMWSSATNV